MREIGRRLQAEQNLTADDVTWLVGIAKAILRAFVWGEGQPMRALANALGVSPMTLYATLRLAVEALMLIRRGQRSLEALLGRVQELQERMAQVEQAYIVAQAEVRRLTKALTDARAQVAVWQAEVTRLQAQWTVTKERLIVVLKMSGRCTVRSIVEVLAYGLGLHVSVGYVQQVIAEAGTNAQTVLERLRQVITLSGAISIDEVFLKEAGRKVLGVVIVDPLSGLVLCLQRCSERSKDALGEVLEQFAKAGFKERIKLCLTDMYAGYLEPVKTYLPQAVHQFCWFHINCFHIGSTVHRAKRAYEKAVKALASFDKKHPHPLSEAQRKQRHALVKEEKHTQGHWRGAQRFQRLLRRALWSSSLKVATARLNQLIRVATKVNNPPIQKMGTFLAEHRTGLLVFYVCLESGQHMLQRLSRSQQRWVSLKKRWAIPTTSNAAEHVFRCLRRYTHQMNHFGTAAATQRFFALFAFYHNVHVLRAGKRAGHSLLAAAHTDVKKLFGTDDPYTILGFPPPSQTFIVTKSVQSVTA
jgi:hypothetical protein